jgi:hypothetical protein
MNVHGAVISILAGRVFPRPVFAQRWRLLLFELCMQMNRWIPMVPRRETHSLLDATPVAVPEPRSEPAPGPTVLASHRPEKAVIHAASTS